MFSSGTESVFVKTQHAIADRKYALNEINCGLVRLPLQKPENCSRKSDRILPSVEPRVSKGEIAADGEFPWMVGIFLRWPLGVWYEHKCGGAIVGKRWILTAAHCLEGFAVDELWIKLGSNRLKVLFYLMIPHAN